VWFFTTATITTTRTTTKKEKEKKKQKESKRKSRDNRTKSSIRDHEEREIQEFVQELQSSITVSILVKSPSCNAHRFSFPKNYVTFKDRIIYILLPITPLDHHSEPITIYILSLAAIRQDSHTRTVLICNASLCMYNDIKIVDN